MIRTKPGIFQPGMQPPFRRATFRVEIPAVNLKHLHHPSGGRKSKTMLQKASVHKTSISCKVL
jgi:hypothetical protein